jgi:hypothetical protein
MFPDGGCDQESFAGRQRIGDVADTSAPRALCCGPAYDVVVLNATLVRAASYLSSKLLLMD